MITVIQKHILLDKHPSPTAMKDVPGVFWNNPSIFLRKCEPVVTPIWPSCALLAILGVASHPWTHPEWNIPGTLPALQGPSDSHPFGCGALGNGGGWVSGGWLIPAPQRGTSSVIPALQDHPSSSHPLRVAPGCTVEGGQWSMAHPSPSLHWIFRGYMKIRRRQ
ncbi:hypothetical protein SUGI_0503550 [Cryptomeria japonica]|nr:hypothetical protein SUGI_0503550 [Cryptomeria japonica]